MKKIIVLLSVFAVNIMLLQAQNYTNFRPGKLWFDTDGNLINAHGGGILFHDGVYYWFGEHKGEFSNAALVGVTCYSSKDLYNWKFERIALSVSDDENSPIVRGSTIERPKVIYNQQTRRFVMYFHLELKGQGYNAAQTGIASSDSPVGPYTFLGASRVNPGQWPLHMTEAQKALKQQVSDFKSWTPEWLEAVKNGLYVRRDFESGQMSRDMTLYVDDDGKAYHIYAAEENYTLNIAELSDDYLSHSGKFICIDPAGHNEAPAIFKKDGKYFMITSGCTGWAPNEARLLVADHILGEWTRYPNPCQGEDAELTFHTQSTYILPVQGKKDAFIFMADRWIPSNPIDGRYVWLPIQFKDGFPILEWKDSWKLDDL